MTLLKRFHSLPHAMRWLLFLARWINEWQIVWREKDGSNEDGKNSKVGRMERRSNWRFPDGKIPKFPAYSLNKNASPSILMVELLFSSCFFLFFFTFCCTNLWIIVIIDLLLPNGRNLNNMERLNARRCGISWRDVKSHQSRKVENVEIDKLTCLYKAIHCWESFPHRYANISKDKRLCKA